MAGRDRDTYIHRQGAIPETMSIISSKNKIYAIPADDVSTLFQIGVMATFDPSETRTINPVRGIGYGDHVAELVPGMTEPMTMTVSRTAQYLSMIYQVFGYKGGIDGLVRSLRHHKWPFDIVQEIVISNLVSKVDIGTVADITSQKDSIGGSSAFSAIVTYFEGCWLSDYSASYAADAALVQESVTVHVTDIIANTSADYREGSTDSNKLFNLNAISKILGEVNPNTAIDQALSSAAATNGMTIQ